MTKQGQIFTGRKANTELSGKQWITRFSGSTSLRDLQWPFRDRVDAFVDALRKAGAKVTISATYRPAERAYLMHWSWLIVKKGIDPATVPAMQGVDINWAHEDVEGKYSRDASNAAARAMVKGFNIENLGTAPALQSQHTRGMGIDMNIRWIGTLVIPDSDGNIYRISNSPNSGMNLRLQQVGATYGVIKYNRAGRDEPHWSVNGA
jgi:hypothetical protein